MSLDAPSCLRTPPDLKWLLNQRAAYLGELARVQTNAETLHQELARLEVKVKKLKSTIQVIENSEQSVQRDIHALDVVLENMHSQVNKDAVKPVSAWAGRYGERGAQKQFIISFLKAAYPHPVKTVALVEALQHKFNLGLPTPQERVNLRHSVRKTLRVLRDADGLVESLHVRKKGTPDGLWRWKEHMPTLEQLEARAQERGDDLAEDRPDGEVGHQ